MAGPARRRLAWALAAFALAAAATGGASAQAVPSVVVVDQERLFQESRLGRRMIDELEERGIALAAENRTIEAELVAEERDLTERRAELTPEEFRPLADAFDVKVERLRAEQDAKTRALVTLRDAERQTFTRSVGPVLLEYMQKTGAAVMLDRRSVVVTADSADITDELIAEIDAKVGDGGTSSAPTPEPVPETAPPPATPDAPAPPEGD